MIEANKVPLTAQTSQVIYIKEERESLVSRGIGSVFGPVVLLSGAAGLIVGGVAGLAEEHSYPIVTALVSGAVATTIATGGVRTLQLIADLGVDATVYAVKLPFRLPGMISHASSVVIEKINNLVYGSEN